MTGSGTEQETRIPLSDGGHLAARLYLPDPDTGPQPCLVEALPYRKDDLTASYAEGYLALRDRFGFAVCRIDVRGTGSSPGDAPDEYPEAEQRDLAEAIAWLAGREWCNGRVGLFGTSYSGFNSLQMACERPPALGAVCAIYATDDRWTDDVHWRGGALRLVDLVDYCHYMTPMCVLPPVPAVWGDGWEAEWRRRLEVNQPWVLTWLRERRYGAYWAHGSVRDACGSGYERIACPVMLVAGWADGYRNNTFRTVAALAAAGVPHRLVAGPWAHADSATAMPGPRIDGDAEMAAWFDHWLRRDSTVIDGTVGDSAGGDGGGGDRGGRDDGGHEDRCEIFVRSSTLPAVDLDLHAGWWLRLPSVPPTDPVTLALTGPRTLAVRPDTGTAAWIDCAGHLPWGQSGDLRVDDAWSLTWDDDPPGAAVVGHPVLRLRLSVDAPAASVVAKLCDVFPDGTSALVSRGSLDLAFRDGVHGAPAPLEPGRVYEVALELDACAYAWAPGQRLRLSVAGSDWPNTVSPPAPVTLTVHEGELTLPVLRGTHPEPVLAAGAPHSAESSDGVGWEIHDDVLARTTTAVTSIDSGYDTPYGGTARERYLGEVQVDRRTFTQSAHADTTFDLSWPGVEVTVRSVMDVAVSADGYQVAIDTWATRDGVEVSHRAWRETLPR